MGSRWGRRILVGVAMLVIATLIGLHAAFRTAPQWLVDRQLMNASVHHLETIGAALQAYAERHGDGHRYPASLEALFQHGLLKDREILRCPAQTAAGIAQPHFVYVGGQSLLDPASALARHETPLMLYIPGLPLRVWDKSGQTSKKYSVGLATDTALRFGRERALSDRMRQQRSAAAQVADADHAALRKMLGRSAPARLRRAAAGELWRRISAGDPPPGGWMGRGEYAAAIDSVAPEVALYMALAVAQTDARVGVVLALRQLKRRLSNDTWAIDGARRRLILEHPARRAPAPALPFAYDPEPQQQQAIDAWILALR